MELSLPALLGRLLPTRRQNPSEKQSLQVIFPFFCLGENMNKKNRNRDLADLLASHGCNVTSQRQTMALASRRTVDFRMKRIAIALIVLFSLISADIATSIIGFEHGAAEINPIYHMQGFQTFLTIKISSAIIGIIIYSVAYHYSATKFPKYTRVLWTLIAFLIGFYTVIIVNNLIVLWSLLV